MITFICCLAALIAGYFIYGSFIERIFGVDSSRQTPAFTRQDGVDYIPMSSWKVFMIQFLNIAGLGPIFGAIMGAKFGVASFLWIVLGTIFAGAVHDYLAGMLSLRHQGESLPEIIGRYLGNNFKQFMRGFTVILMVLVGAVFVAGPAGLLAKLTPEYLDATFWIFVVFIYYILATLLPVDKIIGKVYPLFAAALLFMAVGILVMLFVNHPPLPELTDGLTNTHPENLPIFPIMFVSIACGAISGFHATQSPLMARCIKNEKYGRPVFFGAMITEGIVALIWAAAATYFYHNNGMGESNAAVIVDSITKEWLGTVGGVLAVLGVIAAPITSGDTAFRSARLIIADFLHKEQKSMVSRLVICIPLFIVAIGILLYSLKDKDGFDMIWRYFAWTNQTLAVFTLWALTVFLATSKKLYIITLIPALFMTAVCSTYIFVAPEGLGMDVTVSQIIGCVITAITLIVFLWWKKKNA
ncbi:carbon starvation CstA family protein [Parabacteroides gordonii]|jgi:carbon starvation protein CstA|uniref:carbon starvation CstA family protein n=1 Tax=Parabacteroides gordonii TaxID=574930 RepID=UPI000EBEB2DE|nr:carbon starvation protein A [Parabacteroides gordonii]RGP17114.1 carbon starvation protein A [Parabacteroides gordonii]